MNDDFVDPYVWPGTSILRNKLDIKDQVKLNRAERAITFEGRRKLDDEKPPKTIDADYLCHVHRTLFGELYEWAGEFRTVDISKAGSQFAPVAFLGRALGFLESEISTSGLLSPRINDSDFIEGASKTLANLNYIHPFREGNGRTQRAFLDALAAKSGRSICWRNVSDRDQMHAAVASFNDNDPTYYYDLFEDMLKPPMDGLSRLDSDVYEVIEISVSRPYPPASGDVWVRPHMRNGKYVAGHVRKRRGV